MSRLINRCMSAAGCKVRPSVVERRGWRAGCAGCQSAARVCICGLSLKGSPTFIHAGYNSQMGDVDGACILP